ncbi:MAG: DUF3298 domain-containing protein [Lachnospiraceae bacterium]|nr:DUF3298 domain-containing protein [Lachnospiraceae bacterium]
MKKKWILFTALAVTMMACFSGCGKTAPEQTEKTVEDSRGAESAVQESSVENAATDKQAEESRKDALEGQQFTIVNHKVSCQADGKTWAQGSYPEILLNDAFRTAYPKIAERIDLLNTELSDTVVSDTADYGAWAMEDNFFEDSVYEKEICAYITRADETLFSIFLTYYDWCGGAHPSHYMTAMNLDPATGENLRLDQILDDASQLSGGIRKELEKEYEGVMEEVDSFYFRDEDDDPDQFVNKLKEDSYTFSVDAEGLQIIFSPYEIASYATGELAVLLRYEEYPGLVRETYVMKEAQDIEKLVETKEDENEKVVEPRKQEEN